MIRTTVEMVRNVSYDRLEALIYFSDITENYFSEQIPHMLYRKNFDRIEIIDGQRDCVRLDHPGICTMDVGRILRTFKIKKNVEVTDNGKIII